MQDDAAKQLLARPLSQAVVRGELRKAEYVNYMSDVYCYALHSSQVIAIAGARLTLSHPAMAQYLYQHAAEELGHDKWARSDLLDLGLTSEQITKVRPSSACLRMIGLEYLYAAHENAVGLFGWMFVLESLGAKVGGGLAAAVDKTLKLNGKGMYFLNGHAEADAHHAEDLYRVITENLSSDEDRAVFERMYHESLESYCQILDSACIPDRAAA
jgi:pyrroloquinoline quinone (PQQ) biosynthesis protein C